MSNVIVSSITRTPVDQGGGNWGSVASESAAAYSEDFEGSSVGATLSSLGFARTSGVVDATHSVGSLAAKHPMTLGSDMSQQYGAARTLETELAEGDEFWIQAKFYYPTGWDFGNNGDASLGGNSPRSKFFRLHTKSSGGSNAGYNDLYLWEENATTTHWNWIKEQVDAWAYDGSGGYAPGRPQAPVTAITRGQFSTVEYYIKLHSDSSQARVRVWVDGALEVDISDLATLNLSTDTADEWQFCTYYNGGAPATQDMWTDDWLVYTSASPPTATDASGNTTIGV